MRKSRVLGIKLDGGCMDKDEKRRGLKRVQRSGFLVGGLRLSG